MTPAPPAGGFRAELSPLAFDDADIVGYVLSYAGPGPERLYIGRVGVARPWWRRGVAGGLLVRMFEAARAAGRTTAALGVDADGPTGAVGVYERVGFSVELRATSYALPLVV